MIERARELSKEPNTFWTDQFNNVDNRNAYHDMAKEVIECIWEKILMNSLWGLEQVVVFPEMRKYLKKKFPASVVFPSNLFMFEHFRVAIYQVPIN